MSEELQTHERFLTDLCNEWGISGLYIAGTLNISKYSIKVNYNNEVRLKLDKVPPSTKDRIKILLSIYTNLFIHFGNTKIIRDWLRKEINVLNLRQPIEIVLETGEDPTDLMLLRDYVVRKFRNING